MNQELYPWLNETWLKLQNALNTNRLPGSLLFVGQEGLGEDVIISKLTKTLLCSTSEDDACGFCHSCQLFEAGNHPDYHRIEPEQGKSSIGVEQIRHANRWAMESSQLDTNRVILINLAEMMTESSANAVLKTLEEPPASCVFILNTYNLSSLLATIKSRCQSWVLPAPERQIAKQWLEQNGVAQANDLDCILCGDAPIRIQSFIENKQNQSARQLMEIFSRYFVQREPAAKLLSELKEDPITKLRWIILVLSEVQKQKFGLKTVPINELKEFSRLNFDVVAFQKIQKAFMHLVKEFETFPGLNSELLIGQQLQTLRTELCS